MADEPMMTVYLSRSGRVHLRPTCSGGIRPRDARRVTMTEQAFTMALDDGIVCRCARPYTVLLAPGEFETRGGFRADGDRRGK